MNLPRRRRFHSTYQRSQAWRARWLALPVVVRHGLIGISTTLLVLLLASILFRGRFSTWMWPDSRSEELQMQANAALVAGRLTAADGNGARELFEAALALKPDQVQAREGLARVALAALERAGNEIDQKRYAAASTDLQLAQALDAPRDKVDAILAALQEQQGEQGGLQTMLARASAAHAAGRLDQDEASALPLYQRVLAVQPRNQRAVEGREDALTDLLLPAQAALDRGDVKTVADLLQRAQRFDAGHVDLPALQAGLAQLVEGRARRVRVLVGKGSFERAASICVELRGLQDSRAMPAECTKDVMDGLMANASRLAGDFDFAGSEQLLATATALIPDDPRIRDARRHLAQARQGAAKLPDAHRPSQRDMAKVQALLVDAAKAQARGDWITPPGDSAWDTLRAARALAPGDARVQRALAALEPAARKCQADALRDNRLRDSQACLDVWRQLDPLDRDLPLARQRLAQRWIAIGDQRLERGEINAAAQAAEQARLLEPATPGLAEFSQRLHRAQPGRP